jgi:hypothetical protein
MSKYLLTLALISPAAAAAARPAKATPPIRALQVSPASTVLTGAGAAQSLLVSGAAGSRSVDLTRAAAFRSLDPRIAAVDRSGIVRPVGDGITKVEARAAGRTATVAVRVRRARERLPLSFVRDVLPVLSKAGCNQAACHAKQGGKNGFQLSVFAFDPEADFQAMVHQAAGRRVNRLDPGRSLLLLKPTLGLPHAGGLRFKTGSPEYRLFARWVAEGTRYAAPDEATVARVEILPRERTLAPGAAQQLQATAFYSDGSRRDVTPLAEFRSNETSIAEVDEGGRIHASKLPGEAAVMVRYMGQVAVARVAVPSPRPLPASAYAGLPRLNSIDDLVYRKLARLNLLPSALCDDATFLRRASLDLIGTLPTAEEVRTFLKECEEEKALSAKPWALGTDPRSTKPSSKTNGLPPRPNAQRLTPEPALATRGRWVEKLLARPEYADYWAMRWVNLLLVDRDPLFPKGAFAYDQWVRQAFRENMPFDRFAHDLVTGAGDTYRDGPANFFRSLATPVEQSKSLSQLFLGARLDCAQCHHHPFERWGQDDFYSMAAFFARVRRKGGSEFEQVVFAGRDGELKHPKTDQVMRPRPLGGAPLTVPDDEDRREHLARWMTAPDNPFFARTIANRTWAALMGRGLVEPVDDLRVTNPATNPELLDALAKELVDHGFDLKHLIRTITASAAYQRSSVATRDNARDVTNYSHALVKRLPAEVLLDAVSQVTGVPETYTGHPAGSRAIQLWDNKLPSEFLEVFGRPSRLSVCDCDRPADGSVPQILHLMNAPAVQDRLTSERGTAARVDKSGVPPEQVVEELYLAAYSRPPRPEERRAALSAFSRPGGTRRAAIEDLLWVLINSPEFVFNH